MSRTPAQAKALMSANGKGEIVDTFNGASIATMRSLASKGLVSMQEWAGNGMIGTPRQTGRGWEAKLTDEGWKVHTSLIAKRDYDWDLDPKDVVMIDGEPTIDGMTPQEWLEAMTME